MEQPPHMIRLSWGFQVNKPSKEDFQNEFSILSTQRSFIISASTPEEREDWLTALQDAIHENTKRRSSFDVRKLHKMPSVLVRYLVMWFSLLFNQENGFYIYGTG